MKRKRLFRFLIISFFLEVALIIALKSYSIIKQASQPKFKRNPIIADHPSDEEASDSSEEENQEEAPVEVIKSPEPAFITVDSSYFEDALFIGDSRTVGLHYFGTFRSTFYAKTGIGVNALFEYPTSDEISQATLTHVLAKRQYPKIYIMIGVNDLAFGTLNDFSDHFFSAIDKIREFQPNAVIYIQSILGITKQKEINSPTDFNNQTVINRNAILRSKCDGKKLVYLDLFPSFTDQSGYLNPSYSSDGLHISPDYYYIWEDYLKTHALKIE